MKIQIVIPCINLWNKYTKPCLNSVMVAILASSSGHEYRTVLVDNGSTDETSVEAGKLVSASFFHKRNEERWSCAQSWNWGIKDAWERGFDYVLVLNNDVLLHHQAIDRMIERFQKGNVSGDITTEIHNNQHPLGMVTCLDVRATHTPESFISVDPKDFESVAESDHPNFSAFMINKLCWDSIGEFDEGFKPAYFEDNDYHYRMKMGNIRAITYPPALFYHFGSRTQNEALEVPIVPGEAFNKNRDYFRGKWGGLPEEEDKLFKHPFGNDAFTIKLTKQNHV